MAVVNEWTEAGREQMLVPFLRLLGRVIGDVPPEVREEILKLSASQLEELGDAVLTFNSLHDLQVWLARTA